jgi:TctA family transporter
VLSDVGLVVVRLQQDVHAFRLSMIGAEGDVRVFWSNWLVDSITTLALVLLLWPVFGAAFERVRGCLRPMRSSGRRQG